MKDFHPINENSPYYKLYKARKEIYDRYERDKNHKHDM